MAETAVVTIATCLAPLVVEKMRLLNSVSQEVEQISNKLESIRALLKDANGRQHSQAATKTLINQIRSLAYDIEDIVDEFELQMEITRRPASPTARALLSTPARFMRHMLVRNKIANKICWINSQLQSIRDMKDHLWFHAAAPPVRNNDGHNLRLIAPLLLEESQVVGIDKSKQQLINLLIDEEASDRKVVSVIGMGGVGKTTLARKVTDDRTVKCHFACSAWVTVSQNYRINDLLKTMLTDLIKPRAAQMSLSINLNSMNRLQLSQTAQEFLRDKRYFIVLDDIWSSQVWDELKVLFPENSLHSRVMVTTRSHSVAKYCSADLEEKYVYHLRPLAQEYALALLCKIIFNNKPCPDNLINRFERVLKMCGCLPLAIVTMGGYLLTKNPNEWDMININLSSYTDQNVDGMMFKRLSQVIWLSYADLPGDLKSCLLYFGMYPEDYSIRRGQLLRAWIAEGFIPPKPGQTLEEIAEGYLNELVSRSLIEVILNSYGRVYNCRVHDVIREFVLSRAREQNFLFASCNDVQQSDHVRRLSIISTILSPEILSLKAVRTVFLLSSSCAPHQLLSKFKMLRVLNLSDAANLKKFPDEITSLRHLKYLNMRNTDVEDIPKSIGKLRSLQTLDLKHTFVSRLPNEIVQLLHLRHIIVYRFNFNQGVSVASGTEMPVGLRSLRCLQKLGTLRLDGSDKQGKEIGELTQLRTLGISSGQGQNWSILRTSIKKMKNIDTLWINTGYHEGDVPLDVMFLSELPRLRSIVLRGPLQLLPPFTGTIASNLVKVGLISSKLCHDPFQTFEKLPSLTYLALENAYDGEKLHSTKEGFPKLERLIIMALGELKCVQIDESAMPKLRELRIINCASLQSVPCGIEHLTKLKELNLREMPLEFVRKIRDKGDDREKVRGISSILHMHMLNGRWNLECLNRREDTITIC